MHTIRLAEPWTRDARATRIARKFHWVARLMPGERVWLVFSAPRLAASICINGNTLGSLLPDRAEARFDVTPLLKGTNVIDVLFDCDENTPNVTDSLGDLFGEAVLLVERTEPSEP